MLIAAYRMKTGQEKLCSNLLAVLHCAHSTVRLTATVEQ